LSEDEPSVADPKVIDNPAQHAAERDKSKAG
jgi:hypothetical protein